MQLALLLSVLSSLPGCVFLRSPVHVLFGVFVMLRACCAALIIVFAKPLRLKFPLPEEHWKV